MLALAVLVYAGTGSAAARRAGVRGRLPAAGARRHVLLSLADRWRPRAVLVGYDLLRLAIAVVLALGVLPPLAMLVRGVRGQRRWGRWRRRPGRRCCRTC